MTLPPEWSPILSGIVGSTAYGLAGPDSDVDRLGFAAAPTVAFHGLRPPVGKAATRDSHNPDVVVHEAGKAVSLLLSANPTVSELLWLSGDLYETRTPLGDELIGLRARLLSASRVRNAYLGYAAAQFGRIRRTGRFPDVPVSRTRKHARHLLRLVSQGQALYLTGSMEIRVPDPERYHQFADRFVTDLDQGLELAERLLAYTAMGFDAHRSPLPDQPDEAAAEDWLIRVRAHHYQQQETAA